MLPATDPAVDATVPTVPTAPATVLAACAVLLGAWYGLGDPELEAALGDRLSFRRATPVNDSTGRWRCSSCCAPSNAKAGPTGWPAALSSASV